MSSFQIRPLPKYLPLNLNYPNLELITSSTSSPPSPPLYYCHNFLSSLECDALIQAGLEGGFHPSPVVGDEPEVEGDVSALRAKPKISNARTSTTIYLDREDVPSIIKKVTELTTVQPFQCELPQVAQYLPSQKYDAHFDAFDTSTANGQAFCQNGGQRICTVLIYLNDVGRGGRTSFPHAVWREDLTQPGSNMLDGGSFTRGSRGVSVTPRKGGAVIFFPSHNTSDANGNSLGLMLDPLALHRAEDAVDVKYVSQVWIRAGEYNGVPSRRLKTAI
ncbi:hypothetical protein TL16_g07926 [Triparma laevis f. inornata]|uniref:Fe2OG dioxygenase domain-containing protein n=1 Tax=Triparma laevis f. inornata TaxID=1714386 RepID=A0A9W7EHC3_9STRA|nr:hypothetical protein TL16_g07926 [Triparma laevis f. inornata]